MTEDATTDLPGEAPSRATEATAPAWVLWSGGFDSTAIVLRYLRAGRIVQPVFVRHSGEWSKIAAEEKAVETMRAALGNPPALLPTAIWDANKMEADSKTLAGWYGTTRALASAVGIASQWAVIKFCHDASGISEPLHVGVVCFDDLWERLCHLSPEHPATEFCARLAMPLFQMTKSEVWRQAAEADRAILRLTYSCVEPDEKDGRTCVQRGIAPCKSCARRIPMEDR